MSEALTIGQTAPDLTLPVSGGGSLSLSALRGKKVVLYFYPKDMTSGCTTEAEAFRDLHDRFSAANTVILGVSKDSIKKHDQFIAKHNLPFQLLSDEETGALCDAFGVWVEKSMYGRTYFGIERATFLLNADGVITHQWRKVKVAGHAAAVLKAAEEN
ncbi:thioredoxin-dependent thiol peroxidase [Novispirillum itersonii]|uniref:thioredoxin-dependent thiol peroxidase n=1 Tax=Novispirillum itersonii TaxID=189 RepID=UPI000360A844|nr:thioredoxin-dependent thiol peroxidase [Novispirillum itersonii]